MSDYIIHNGELYHHGVKGMKWGVRRERAKRARVAAGIRMMNSKRLKKLEKWEAKRTKKARYEEDTTKLDKQINLAKKYISTDRKIMNKAMSGLTQKELDKGRRQVSALIATGSLTGVIGSLTTSSILAREYADVAKKYGTSTNRR